MSLPYTFRGLIAPVFTPFNYDSKRSLNLGIIPKYAKYLANNGVDGILVNGTTGEGTSISVAERNMVVEAWSNTVKSTKQHLMVQIGGASLPDVLELARFAESIKVDALLCLPELYFKPNTLDQLKEYLQCVSNAAPNTPLLYYHIPTITNVHIHMGQFLESIDDEIPSFVGIKFTSNDLEEGMRAFHAANNKYVIFLGSDQIMCAATALGMDSFIATSINLFPKFIQEMLAESKLSNVSAAREKQRKLSKAIIAISKYGSWVTTMKQAMFSLTGIDLGPTRMPLKSLTDKMLISMKEDLKSLPNELMSHITQDNEN